ncbi:MAG: UDP-N-acetylmuramate dehydrogenase [Rhodospirillales bacterium]|jgi:UDP-N-acetylmuramate dehydrogenase|nr:UDP-N-acetylmuramate dehydrogenase [Rhodospirillales bacterium]
MNQAVAFNNNLSAKLPQVRGTYEEDASLKKYTWFRTGGPAEVLYTPADIDDLMVFMNGKPRDTPVTMIGLGSNMIIRDGGVPGVVIRLGKGLANVNVRDDKILVGGGALDSAVAAAARDAGLTGFEFLSGVPGTIGGALRMNAGAFDQAMQEIVVYARVLDLQGNLQTIAAEDLGFGYRSTSVPEGWIFAGAMLQGMPGERGAIAQKMEEIRAFREESQPMREKTGGSTFHNPEHGEAAGRKAWEIIDGAGCRGLTLGGAKISEKHCNFLINTGDASSQDLEDLGEMVRKRVLSASGVSLEWEVRRIGLPLSTTESKA